MNAMNHDDTRTHVNKQSNDNSNGTHNDNSIHIVIVGAGMAGLTAAQTLLTKFSKNSSSSSNNTNNTSNTSTKNMKPNIHITIVEGNDYVGGRIKGDETLVKGYVIDEGAEIIHGQGTLLTKLVDKYYNQTNTNTNTDAQKNNQNKRKKWQEIIPPSSKEKLTKEHFLLSHADGGPDIQPTKDGQKYGMYYVNHTLMMYNDPRILPLERSLAKLHDYNNDEYVNETDHDHEKETKIKSIGQVLELQNLSPELISLAVASYGNTIGSCDMYQISLPLLLQFENYWQHNEEEGDVTLSSKIGMVGIVKELYFDLCEYDHFRMRLDSFVTKIDVDVDDNVDVDIAGQKEVMVFVDDKSGAHDNDNDNENSDSNSDSNTIIKADYVIVTTPPPLWKSFLKLTQTKKDAIDKLGMNKAIKIAIKLTHKFWPDDLQSIIMADCIIPEMWFSEFENEDENEDEDKNENENEDCYVVICFLTSQKAEELEECTLNDTTQITELFLDQMSKVFSVHVEDIRKTHLETRIYKWKYAYVFPKVGFSKAHFHELAKPMDNIHFAGEATNTNACCTVQAAMETGVREAEWIIQKIECQNQCTDV